MFGHLQIKSCYSFQQSTILIQDLIDEAVKHHIPALTLTDVDNMYGVFEFYTACSEANIKPLIGVEASILINDEIYPLTLIAMDDAGYFDLIGIVSDICTKEKQVDLETLADYKDHLIIMSASNESIIERLLLKEMDTLAEEYMRQFVELFGSHYYVMAHNHKVALYDQMTNKLINLARYVGVKVVFGNDVSYLRQQDALAVDLMQAAAADQQLSPHYQPMTTEKYLKTETQMQDLFSSDIIRNTYELIDLCHVSVPRNIMNLPRFPVPNSGEASDYLMSLCRMGLKKRFKGQQVPSSYVERLRYELKVIHTMGFDDYFLIVWDYVRYAKMNHIVVGPGRGSAAGSLVAYVLGITNIDPMAYDLLFERFLNPERVSMPDIDIDFQDDRRDEVIQYVIDKYGQDHVAQIVTFTTYGPRVAIKEIGQVMGLPAPRLELLAKMVPTGGRTKKTITEVYETSASFQSIVNSDPTLRKLIGIMSVVEHLPRNISMHAGGVVLCPKPLKEVVPLVKGPSDAIMTQFSKNYIEKAGLLKMDLLGLRNLTVLDYILEDLKRDTNISLNLNEIPFDDAKTFDLLSRGDTFGVFQLESNGMRALLRRMKPNHFNDIVAANAMYRPGPMDNISEYLARRHKQKPVTYLIPELEDILSSTYGIIIYQEQIMQIAVKIAGFTMGKADTLRKGVSKKDPETIATLRAEFVEGTLAQGYSREVAVQIYDLIEKFADYGFNKSHSVAYACVAYQAAYLKANYPKYFYAAILSNSSASKDTKRHVIEESRRYGTAILPPSINRSSLRFMVEKEGIRYSLVAIKNVGAAAYQAIIKERDNGPFTDMYDFLLRMRSSHVSTKVIESLIDAGAFDEFNTNRAFLKGNLDIMMNYVTLKASLGVDEEPILRDIRESRHLRLENEKEVLDIYLSTHPIVFVKEKLPYDIVALADVNQYGNRSILIVMTITRVRTIVDKRGNQMAFVEGSDETGTAECVCFANQYSRFRSMIERGNTVLMEVRVQIKDRTSLIINQVREVKTNE